MDIIVAAGSTLATPAPGTVTLFINTEDDNVLSYKDSTGTVHRYNGSDDDEGVHKEFAYKLAKRLVEAAQCAMANGTMDPDEYNTFINTGINVKVKQTEGGDGTKTYDINIGPRNINESY